MSLTAPIPSDFLSRLRQLLRDPLPAMGITLRTALLAWLVAIGTLMIFVAAVIPEQKRVFLENLWSKAHGVTVSLRDITAGAAVNEDFSSVVDHCSEMLKGDASIDYIVITRNDGFSLVHDRTGWRVETVDERWHPAHRVAFARIERVPLFNRRVYAYAQPFDYSGIEWGWIHVGLSLDAYDQSVTNVYRRTGLLVLATTLLGLFASIIYARHLVRPILLLQTVVERVAAGDLSVRTTVDRRDELGRLASSVTTMTEALLQRDRTLKEANETLENRVVDRTRELQEQVEARERTNRELADAQRRLMQLSREAGMAEVATGVLHNVGNVLNSVNVSATLIHETLAGSEVATLVKVTALLEAHAADLGPYLTTDPKGRLVPGLLAGLAAQLAKEQRDLVREHELLGRNVEHIKQIVAMQQSYARVSGLVETLSLAQLVDDALQINSAGLTRHGVRVEQHYEKVPAVTVDKHKVIQILVNLIRNAKYALDYAETADRVLWVEVRPAGVARLHVIVRDNGVGIPPENLTRIFSHGFTTRQDGHGFGLHSGANAAREMGGQLTAYSAGPGRGATFTLELPVTTEKGKS